jgi:hypothetical protein
LLNSIGSWFRCWGDLKKTREFMMSDGMKLTGFGIAVVALLSLLVWGMWSAAGGVSGASRSSSADKSLTE